MSVITPVRVQLLKKIELMLGHIRNSVENNLFEIGLNGRIS
jgi:hypothetical protein